MNPDAALSGGFTKDYRKAFDYLFNEYYAPLCVFAEKFLHSQEDARDVVAEVFKDFWERKTDLTSLRSVKAFIYTSVRNKCINQLKKTGRRSILEEDIPFYNNVVQPEVLLRVNESINSLPRQCKKVFKLLYFEGLPLAQVAQRLKLSLNTVKNQKQIAIKKLNSKLFGDDVFTIAIAVGTAAAITTLGALLFFLLTHGIK